MLKIVIFIGMCYILSCSNVVNDSKYDHKVFTAESFYKLRPFEGKIISYRKLGMPETTNKFSGEVLNITLTNNKGDIYIIDQFLSGKHALKIIDSLITKGECEFPYDIYQLRDSILWD